MLSTQEKLRAKLRTVVKQYNKLQDYICNPRSADLHIKLAQDHAKQLQRTYTNLIKFIDLGENESRNN